jgi:hypothetical protein
MKRDITGLREDMVELIRETEYKIKEMLSDADKFYVDEFDKIKEQLKETKTIARDSVKTKEKELSDVIIKT